MHLQSVSMEIFAWSMEWFHLKAVWKFVSTWPGALSVMTSLEHLKHVWSADSWDSHPTEPPYLLLPPSAKELTPLCSMTWCAQELKLGLLTALEFPTTTASILKMLELGAGHVSNNDRISAKYTEMQQVILRTYVYVYQLLLPNVIIRVHKYCHECPVMNRNRFGGLFLV